MQHENEENKENKDGWIISDHATGTYEPEAAEDPADRKSPIHHRTLALFTVSAAVLVLLGVASGAFYYYAYHGQEDTAEATPQVADTAPEPRETTEAEKYAILADLRRNGTSSATSTEQKRRVFNDLSSEERATATSSTEETPSEIEARTQGKLDIVGSLKQ